jgi:hypothetical protein
MKKKAEKEPNTHHNIYSIRSISYCRAKGNEGKKENKKEMWKRLELLRMSQL